MSLPLQEVQDMGLMPGCEVPRPNMVKRDELGSGGNGTVFKQFISGQEYAIKRVRRYFSILSRLLFHCVSFSLPVSL